MIAWLNLRHSVPQRRAAFQSGLERLGFRCVDGLPTKPGAKDIFVTWNRIGPGQTAALGMEYRGNAVIVAENASWGNDFNGGHWYTLARGHHNVRDAFPVGGPERWDSLGLELSGFRHPSDYPEQVALPSRGIGPPGYAMPIGWREKAARDGYRVRNHPGQNAAIPLEQDLAKAWCVLTWGSGAAIKAGMMGLRVRSDLPNWIGEDVGDPERRLATLRRMAWAQWQLHEIESGEPFARLLEFKA